MTDLSVLVVEDEIMLRLAIAEELRGAGFVVFEASNGDEAVTLLESIPEVEIVCTDVLMPGLIDGIELARWIETHHPAISVVLISAEIEDAAVSAEALFLKPLNYDQFITKIKKIANGHYT